MSRPQTRSAAASQSSAIAIGVFVALILFRGLNAVAIETFFQPDEYYQALEPAWRLAFGKNSGAWLTWEWREQLRSAIQPMLIAGVYRIAAKASQILNLTAITRASVLIGAPKAFQVIVAAAIDFYSWKLSNIAYGPGSPETIAVLLLTACNPWQWYVSTRTFSNTLETLLTAIALAYVPWQWLLQQDADAMRSAPDAGIDLQKILREGGDSKDFSKPLPGKKPEYVKPKLVNNAAPKMGNLAVSLFMAALACAIRPTNGIIWAALFIPALYSFGDYEKGLTLVKTGAVAATAVLGASVLVDRAFYGSWTITQYRFLYINVVDGISNFYGRNRIDYYFTEGLPMLLTTLLPFAVLGFWQSIRPGPDRQNLAGYYERQLRYLLAVVIASTTIAFSMIAHKEARFIYSLLPMLHVLAARPLVAFFKGFPLPEDTSKLALLVIGIGLNTYIQSYFGLVHQRGVIGVMDYLRHEAEIGKTIKDISVGFLMPCHSTPWRSHLVHQRIKAWALTCEPPLDKTLVERQWYEDEADQFYNHPGGWLSINMVDRSTILKGKPYNGTLGNPTSNLKVWPDYLVFFEQLEPTMNGALDRTRYKECWRAFNTHWHEDWRRRGDVVVHCLDKS